jgi:hypothetical protein
MLFDEGAKTRYSASCPEVLNMPGKVVWTLLNENDSFDKGHLLATDNFYSDIVLAEKLLSRETDFIGTIRKDRRLLPASVMKPDLKKLSKNSVTAKFNGQFRVMHWLDSNEVRILSSVGSTKLESKEHSKRKDLTVSKPGVVFLYNTTMPGVDLNDQMKFQRKTARNRIRKYHHKMFFHILDIVLINTFIYVKHIPVDTLQNITHQDFRLTLIREILDTFQDQDPQDSRILSKEEEASVLAGHHLLVKTNIQKVCDSCSKGPGIEKNHRNKTSYKCLTCDLNLCFTDKRNCYYDHHLKLAQESLDSIGIRKRTRSSK